MASTSFHERTQSTSMVFRFGSFNDSMPGSPDQVKTSVSKNRNIGSKNSQRVFTSAVWGRLVLVLISGVKITSEKGGDCTLVNPWPEKSVSIIRNGKLAETATGERFTLKTAVNEIIELK